MFKKKHFSVYEDFKTGFFCKLSLFLGLFLLLVYVFLKIGSFLSGEDDTSFLRVIYDISQSGLADSVIAFSIVLLGLGVILYFFHCQFAKLAKIADEIEKEEFKENEKED